MFSEKSDFSKNIKNITYEKIFPKSYEKKSVKKALISSMWGKGCIMLTPLVKNTSK